MNEELRQEIIYAIVDSLIESDVKGIGMIGHNFKDVLMWYKGVEYKIKFEEDKKCELQ